MTRTNAGASRSAYITHERTLFFAHRGGSALAPENTLPAFENGLKLGADALETDIHYTRDGETGWVNRDCSAAGLAEIMADIIRQPEQIVVLNRAILERRDQMIKSPAAHVAEMDAIYDELVIAPTDTVAPA